MIATLFSTPGAGACPGASRALGNASATRTAAPLAADPVNYSTNFEGFAEGTTEESLTVPGVVFAGLPPQSFQVFSIPASEQPVFTKLSNKTLLSSNTSMLDITFDGPVTSFAIDFGNVGGPAPELSLTLEGFDASSTSIVKSATTATPSTVQGGFVFSREATAQLSSNVGFRRVRLSFTAATTSTVLVDNLRASGSGSSCDVYPASSVSALVSQVAQGQAIPLAVTVRPAAAGPIPSINLQIQATNGGVPALISYSARSVDSTTNVLFVRVGSDAFVGDVRLQAQVATPGCLFGPLGEAASVRVVIPPVAFVSLTPAVSWLAGVADGGAPPSTSFEIKNVGGMRGTTTFSAAGGFFTASPAAVDLDPGAKGTVTLTATVAAARTPGLTSGLLTATSGNDSITVPVSLLVVSGSAAPGARPNAKAVVSANRLVFSAPAGQNPAPQTLTLSVSGLSPSETAVIQATAGADSQWLVLPGTVAAITGTQQLNGQFRVDRARRATKDAVLARRTLVTLTVVGGAPGSATIVEVLDVEPPTVQTNAGGDRRNLTGQSFVVPTAVKAPGQFGASFLTDGWLRNESAFDVPADLYFAPDGRDGLLDATVRKASVTVPANRTIRLSDGLDSVFATTGSGQIEVKSPYPGLLSVRTKVESVTNGDPTSRYGTEIPTVARGSGIGLGQGELVVGGIFESPSNRTNLILTETSGAQTTVRVTVYDVDGSVVGSRNFDVPAFGKIQLGRIVTLVSPSRTVAGGSASVSAVSGAGRVVAVAIVIDNRSNSFSAILGQKVRATSARAAGKSLVMVIPSAVKTTGAFNTSFTTSLSMVNGTASPANLTLTYQYTDLDDGNQVKNVQKTLSIVPLGSLPQSVAGDVLSALFGVTNRSFGWIKVEGDISRIVASAAISSQVDPGNPALGLKTAQVQALLTDSPDVLAKDLDQHLFAGAEKSEQRRTNLVLEEVAGLGGDVDVWLASAAGDVLARKTYSLSPGQYLQITDVFGSFDLGNGPYQNVQILARMKGGSGKVVAFASVIDNESKNTQIFVLKAPGPPEDPTFGF